MLLILNSNFAYATWEKAECGACTTTLTHVDNYISMTEELISTLQTFAIKQSSVLKKSWQTLVTNGANQINTNNDGRFVETDVNRQVQSIVDTLNTKAQSAATSVYTVWLIGFETAALDSWKNIMVMTSSPSLMRDWQKLDRAWQLVANTMLDLWNAGVFIRLWFKEWRDQRIEEILVRYSSMESAPITYKAWSVKNYQPISILQWLWRMNQSLKTTLAIWDRLVDDTNNSFLNKNVTFSQSMKENISIYYNCIRGVPWSFTCSRTWQRAKDNLNATRKNSKSEVKNATETIKNALKRLSGFRSSNAALRNSFKERSNELLRSEYGWQWVRNNEWKPIIQSSRDARKNLKADINALWPLAWFNLKQEKKQWLPQAIWDLATARENWKSSNNLYSAFATTRQLAKQNRNESTYTDVSPITKALPQITEKIIMSKAVVEWQDKNSLVNNLWKACDLQCTNVWGKCRYE